MPNGLEALETVIGDYVAASNAADVEALKATLTDDMVAMPPDVPALSGAEAFGAFVQENFYTPFELGFGVDVAEGEVHGTTAWTRGTFSIDLRPRDGGAPSTVKGDYMAVFRQEEDGSWKYHRLIWNTDAPMAGA